MRHDTSVPLNTVRPYAHVFELIRLCGFVRFSKSVRLPALPRTFESLWRNLASNQREDGSIVMLCRPLK